MNNAVTLAVDREPRGDELVVLALVGELVVTNREILRMGAEAELARGARSLVIAVERLTHIDTPGLALLVHLAGRCAERSGRLAVAGLQREFQELRQHLLLDEAILFGDDVEAAVAAISSVVA